MIGSDGTKWPIYMDGTEMNMEPGDATIYLGCEIVHWREEILKHKWIESEKAGHDVGFEWALLDWNFNHRNDWRSSKF